MLTYRNAWTKDIENIQELAVKLCSWESQHFDKKYDWNNPLSQEWFNAIKNAIKSEDYLVLLVEDIKTVVWFLIASVSVPAFYWDFKKLSELHKMYVDENYRKRWIWDELMKRFMQFSKDKNADRMEIYTFFENEVNIFYEKFWFEKKALFLRKEL